MKNFASDNVSGIHPEILKAIIDANFEHATGYGEDIYTDSAIKKFKQIFGQEIDVFFVFSGTAANVLSIAAVANSFNAVICAQTAHLNVHECGAPEKFTGCKILTIPSTNAKITPKQIEQTFSEIGDVHVVQPKIVSITQATEHGTLYSVKEIKEIADFVHKNNLLLHMDGARISNACAALGVSLKQMTVDAGVDVLSFGGTKNGMAYGDAIIFFNKNLSKNFKFIQKQGMQLASKMRFISAQFDAFLSNNLYLKNAEQANKMAQLLGEKVSKISKVKLTQKIETNQVFAIIPTEIIKKLQEKCFFYIWNENTSEVRWVTSFDTTEKDINDFVDYLKKLVK